ncbi:MAG: hypothetical protein ACRDO8_02240 [Nocardioidaceae bacterium]
MAIELAPAEGVVHDQDGVLARPQAYALFGRHHTEAQIAAHRWQRPARGVIVMHNGPLTPAQQDWVALLACAPGSVLGGLTALGYDGFTGFADEVRTVVQPMGARRPSYEDLDVRWSIWLDSQDVHPLRLPPRTRPARSLVDAASWQHFVRRARAIILAGVQQQLVATRHLREAMIRRGSCKHRALIVESILDAHGGVQSLPELDFEHIRRRIGAPPPTRQSVRRRKDGKCYLDVEWVEYETGCEIHGIPHIRVLSWESDLERANEITIDGPRLLIFSSYAVRREQERVADQLLRMLRRGGWRG